MTTRPPRLQVGLAAVLALFGFLVAAGFLQERLREAAIPERRAELERLVRQRRASIAELSSEVEALSRRVTAAQTRSARESDRVQEVVRRARRLEVVAGLDAVRGPGVVVQLSDSEREPRTRDEITDLRIQDVDLRLVVNALWRSGAEAVSVNGRRVVATTAIRKAGTTILVNYRAVTSPYRVAAIGDPEALEEQLLASDVAKRFDVWDEIYGLAFSVEAADSLTIPAPRGFRDVRWARPAEKGR